VCVCVCAVCLWSLVSSLWSLWSLWSLVSSLWSLVSGLWSLVSGTICIYILIKRCDTFADPLTKLYLPASTYHLQVWPPHTNMPADLVSNIKERLATIPPSPPAPSVPTASEPQQQQRCVLLFHSSQSCTRIAFKHPLFLSLFLSL
jgi:hypothetical protein